MTNMPVKLLLALLLAATTGAAQDFLATAAPLQAQTAEQPPPVMRPPSQPAAKQLTPEQVQREAWRQSMLTVSDSKTGCFKATYPTKVWQSIPCKAAPNYPLGNPVTGFRPSDVGNLNGDYRAQSSGTISSAIGSFPEVDNVTSETGTLLNGKANTPNIWGLQLNTNQFTTTACSKATESGCQGWEQFAFTNEGSLLIQTWLLSYGSPCPKGWNVYNVVNSANVITAVDCWENSAATPAPVQPLGDLAEISIEGMALTGGSDMVILSTPGALYRLSASDSVLNLAKSWTSAEFNIFGEYNGTQALFNGGALFSVKVNETDGTTNAPTCIGGSTTGETNNLTLATPCSPFGGNSPGINFLEGRPPTITSIGPGIGSEDGGTVVTITGTGFSKNMEADFGGVYVGMFNSCNGTTQCTVMSPQGAGTVDITVGNLTSEGAPGVFSATTPADRFSYEPFPSGTMQPHTGPPSGGTQVTITGHNFSTAPGATVVTFNFNGVSTPALNVLCSSTAVCTMTTPPLNPISSAPAVTPVSVTVNGMTSAIGGFTYPTQKPIIPPGNFCLKCKQDGGVCVVENGKQVCKGTLF
jgi:hypothetical protein